MDLQPYHFHKPSPGTLTNERTGKAIATRIMAAKTLGQRARGLMLRRISAGEALIFPMGRRGKVSLHMLFVFTPIDVLYCNKRNGTLLVVDKKEDFKPFTFTTSEEQSDTVIELPAGAAKKTERGDKLLLTPTKTI